MRIFKWFIFKPLLLILILTLCACNRGFIKDLRLLNGIYVNKNGDPYTGTVVSYFDSGELSNKITIKNGVPNGEWASYGYDGEIIQIGSFKPYILGLKIIGQAKGFIRVSISNFKEGGLPFTQVYIINNSFDKTIRRIYDPNFFKEVVTILIAKGVPLDNKDLDELTFCKGEI